MLKVNNQINKKKQQQKKKTLLSTPITASKLSKPIESNVTGEFILHSGAANQELSPVPALPSQLCGVDTTLPLNTPISIQSTSHDGGSTTDVSNGKVAHVPSSSVDAVNDTEASEVSLSENGIVDSLRN